MTAQRGDGGSRAGGDLTLRVPSELVEAIARHVAELVTERVGAPGGGYLNVEQAADYLAAPSSRIYDLVERRRVRVYRDGRRLLFRREDLDAALRIEQQ